MSDFPIKVRANLIKANNLPMSTTSTAIKTYINWLEQKLAETEWGEVSISFTICNSQITDIKKGSIDSEHYPLKRKGE